MAILNSSITTALAGLVGAVFGTLVGHYFNQKLSLKNARKDTMFKRKLEYFEKLAETIESNIKTYQHAFEAIKSNKKDTAKITTEMKENRQKFYIKASPLYIDKKKMSEKITEFVDIEKGIFSKFESKEITKTEVMPEVEKSINLLKTKANEILFSMKQELKNE